MAWSNHSVCEPGCEVILRVLEGPLAGRYRAAVIGSDRKALYVCISLTDDREGLPPGSKVRVYFTAEDGTGHSFDSHTVAAGSGLSACFGVAWPGPGRQERREHVRQEMVLPVVIELLQPHAGAGDAVTGRFPGVISDLSQGGASVHCRDLQAHEGDVLRLKLRLPGHQQAFEVQSQVIWVRRGERLVGLQFMEMSPEVSEQLQRIIDLRQRDLARAVEARLRGAEPVDAWPRPVDDPPEAPSRSPTYRANRTGTSGGQIESS